MKSYFTILFLLLVSFMLNAKVDQQKAIAIASNFLFGETEEIKDFKEYSRGNDNGIYVINFMPNGWALVASSENVRPIIGYSLNGYFDVDKVQYNVKDWLDIKVNEIELVSDNQKWSGEWEQLEKGRLSYDKSAQAVEPLLEVEWDQDASWNRFCPDYANGPDGKAYVGCVAVAMGQALHHIKFPPRPQGQKSYQLSPYGTIATNFDEEPAYEWDKMELKKADDYNARLMYNCGVAVEMDYGGSGSGAYTTRVPFAFQHYFGFTPSVKCIDRYSDTGEWVKLIKKELDAGNVLIYSGNPGTGEAGHAFNLDGYSASGYFHFNWGWSGSYNGYFSINDVAPGNYDFKSGQRLVTGISKPYWGPVDIDLSNLSVVENLPAGTVVGEISVTDYTENDAFTFKVYGAPYFDGSGYAPAKFEVVDMKLKTLEPLVAGEYPEVATIEVEDKEGLTYKEGFEIIVQKANSVDNISVGAINIYPNPFVDRVYIDTQKEISSFALYTLSGQLMFAQKLNGNRIQLESIDNGTYLLHLKEPNGAVSIHKVVKQ